MENQLQKEPVLVDDTIHEILSDKPAIAPAKCGPVHKGKK